MNAASPQPSSRDLHLLSAEHAGADVVMIRLDRSAHPLPYHAGQYLVPQLPDGQWRAYSLAAPCRADGRLELHARVRPGGALSRWLASSPAPGTALRGHGPCGDCV